ncbi:MAG: hypothetical protein JXA93_02305 [Anaerolineae bacterium]|nr:hypothetical protein [Anaerolineae bacterium]
MFQLARRQSPDLESFLVALTMNELDRQRVAGGFAGRAAAIVCDDFLQEA